MYDPRWLRQQFLKADKENDGVLSFGQVQDLLERINVKLSPKYAKKIFNVLIFSLYFYPDFEKTNLIFRQLMLTKRLEMVNKY